MLYTYWYQMADSFDLFSISFWKLIGVEIRFFWYWNHQGLQSVRIECIFLGISVETHEAKCDDSVRVFCVHLFVFDSINTVGVFYASRHVTQIRWFVWKQKWECQDLLAAAFRSPFAPRSRSTVQWWSSDNPDRWWAKFDRYSSRTRPGAGWAAPQHAAAPRIKHN